MTTEHGRETDYLGAWSEAQRSWMRLWADSLSGFSRTTEGGEGEKEPPGPWKSTGPIYDQWLKMSQDMFGKYWENAPSGIGAQTFARTLGAAQIHSKLYEFWANAAKVLSGTPAEGKGIQETYQEFYNSWLKSYSEVLRGFFGASLFEPLGWPGGAAAELVPMYGDALSKFSRPWMEAIQGLPQKLAEALQKGPQASGDVFRWWLQPYEQTWGRVLRMPPLGPTRETIGIMQKGIEAMVDYYSVTTDFWSALYQVGTEAMQKVMAELGRMYGKGQAPKTYGEFYQLWWKTNEDTVNELYKTPEFSRLLGSLVDSLMLVRKRYNEIMEEYLKALPIPTRTEMDDLYKTLYLLKKEVKKNARQMSDLQERLRRTGRAAGKEQS